MNRVIGNCTVKKTTNEGICIRKDGQEAWFPLRYVAYDEETKTLSHPDWIAVNWKEERTKKKRKVSLNERVEKALSELRKYEPLIELRKRKGKYVILMNGRKKHWGELGTKEALVVITTILALVKS